VSPIFALLPLPCVELKNLTPRKGRNEPNGGEESEERKKERKKGRKKGRKEGRKEEKLTGFQTPRCAPRR
jgi:hypothetical protein